MLFMCTHPHAPEHCPHADPARMAATFGRAVKLQQALEPPQTLGHTEIRPVVEGTTALPR